MAAGLRLAETERIVALPVDLPLVSPHVLTALGEAATGVDAAVPQTGPLPGAYARSALTVLERRIAAGKLALHEALEELETRVVPVDAALLANVNTPGDLETIAAGR